MSRAKSCWESDNIWHFWLLTRRNMRTRLTAADILSIYILQSTQSGLLGVKTLENKFEDDKMWVKTPNTCGWLFVRSWFLTFSRFYQHFTSQLLSWEARSVFGRFWRTRWGENLEMDCLCVAKCRWHSKLGSLAKTSNMWKRNCKPRTGNKQSYLQ